MEQLGTFLGVALLVIVTPGQDTALTIRNALLGDRRAGFFTAAGVASGQAVWSIAASAGQAALLLASAPLFAAVKLAGALYLIVIGAQSLVAALHHDAVDRADVGDGRPLRRVGRTAAFRQGLVSNLGNPKMALFFSSLLPQFAPRGGSSFPPLLARGLLFCMLTLAWLSGYAYVVARAGNLLRRPQIRRIFAGLTGLVLVRLGLRLASTQR